MSSSIQKKTRGKTKRKKKEHTRTGRHRNHYKNKKSLYTDYEKKTQGNRNQEKPDGLRKKGAAWGLRENTKIHNAVTVLRCNERK